MPYCGTQWVSPGSVCPDGSQPTATRGGGPAAPPAGSTQVVSSEPITDGTNQDSVFVGMVKPVPGARKRVPKYTSKTGAEDNWLRLTEERRQEINDLAKRIDYRGTGRSLYAQAVGAAARSRSQGVDATPESFLDQLLGEYPGGTGAGGSGSGTGRGGAYSGPVKSVVVQSEADIRSMAQATAQELLGRSATDEEVEKILRRTRKAEMAQPQVTRREGPGMTITEQGLTKEGRDAILNQVLMKSPDYAGYQIDSTMMDMFSSILRKGQEVARG